MEVDKSLLIYLIACFATVTGGFHNGNYILENFLNDGEKETRIQFKNLYAMETRISYDQQDRSGLLLWQLTDGDKLIQSIYSMDMQLKDCEYINAPQFIKAFTQRFQDDAEIELLSLQLEDDSFSDFKNVSFKKLSHKRQLPQHLTGILNYKDLYRECKKLHHEIKKLAHAVQNDRNNPKVANEINRERIKRSVFTITEPTTNWCGMGSYYGNSYKYGPSMGADYCCSQHDKCMFSISGMSKKFEYFNFRLYTISHCDCDERFRTCLKTTNTAPSNLVGKVFFNIIQTKCFILKAHKVCSKRSWWGKCLKWELKKKATLRDPIPY